MFDVYSSKEKKTSTRLSLIKIFYCAKRENKIFNCGSFIFITRCSTEAEYASTESNGLPRTSLHSSSWRKYNVLKGKFFLIFILERIRWFAPFWHIYQKKVYFTINCLIIINQAVAQTFKHTHTKVLLTLNRVICLVFDNENFPYIRSLCIYNIFTGKSPFGMITMATAQSMNVY